MMFADHLASIPNKFRFPAMCAITLACVALLVAGCNWTENVSVSSSGELANDHSESPSISQDGRYVAFSSKATNLVSGAPSARHIYLRDTLNGTLFQIDLDSTGNSGNNDAFQPVMSANGRFVAFTSIATNLVADDTNGAIRDVFLHDTLNGTTSVVSLNAQSAQSPWKSDSPAISGDGRFVTYSTKQPYFDGSTLEFIDTTLIRDTLNGTTMPIAFDLSGNAAGISSHSASLSADGRYVAFQSRASTLVPGDTNGSDDSFLRDTVSGATTRVNIDSAGNQANNLSILPGVSANGRFVAFTSAASNLVIDDTNNEWDVFLHDTVTSITTRVSVDSAGNEANDRSHSDSFPARPGISENGRYVAFMSEANNLVPNDTNGAMDVFVRDTLSGTTSRISQNESGDESNRASLHVQLSADGRYAAFWSGGTNLVADDINGKTDIFIRALPQLAISSIEPNTLPVGATTPVTITGSNFLPETFLVLDAQVSNIVIVDEQTITADISVPANAAAGAYNLNVYLQGTGPGLARGAAAHCEGCLVFSGNVGC